MFRPLGASAFHPTPGCRAAISAVVLAAATWVVAQTAAAQTCAPPPDAPNIVFILFDDLGYGTLGSYGGTTIATPHVDAFAAEAKQFNQYYVNAPVCTPARISVLTGDYPHRFNIRSALSNGSFFFRGRSSKLGIPEYIFTLPEMLRSQCYRTVHLGKWHAGRGKEEFEPTAVGFDEWAIRIASLANTRHCGYYWDETMQRHDGTTFSTCPQLSEPLNEVVCEEVCTNLTDWQVDEAIGTIKAHQANDSRQPLFLNLWLLAPHNPFVLSPNHRPNQPIRPPFTAPSEIVSLYDGIYSGSAQGYAALTTHADRRLGDLLNDPELEEFWRNTLIFITSDNGAPTIKNGAEPATVKPKPNGALRGSKGTSWEGGTRVPMMVRWPAGRIPGGPSESDFPFVSFDIYPTLADLLGLDLESLGVAGQSVAEHLLRPDTAPTAIKKNPANADQRDQPVFWEWGDGRIDFAVRDGRWKYIRRHGDHLFDMAGPECVDPGRCESRSFDLALTNPELAGPIIARLAEQYRLWRRDSTRINWGLGCVDPTILVADEGQLLDFGTGGRAELCGPAGAACRGDDPLFDFHDRSFTFALRVRADAFPAAGETSWIAGKDGSWSLTLRDDRHLELAMTGEGCGSESCLTTMAINSDEPLPIGVWTHVAFIVFPAGTSHRGFGYQDVRLYVDGVEQRDRSPVVEPKDSKNEDSKNEGSKSVQDAKSVQASKASKPPRRPRRAKRFVNTKPTVLEGVLDIASNRQPVTLGGHDPTRTESVCGSAAIAQNLFRGAISYPRFHTAGFVAAEFPNIARAPIRWEVESLDDGAVQGDGIFSFASPGRVKLKGACAAASCVTDYPLFDFGEGAFSFGVAVWPDPPASGRIQGQIAGKGQAWQLLHTSDDTVRLVLNGPDCGTDCDDTVTLESSATLFHQQWHHVAFTVEKNLGGYQTVRLYIDGRLEATSSQATPGNRLLSLATDNGQPIVLGGPFLGSLALVRMDLETLEAADVALRARLEIDLAGASSLSDIGLLNGGFTYSADLRPHPVHTLFLTSSTVLAAGVWSNVVFQVEQSSVATRAVRLFVDGVEVSDITSEAAGNLLEKITQSSANAGSDDLTPAFRGTLRNVRVFARDLEPAEITAADP